MWTGRYLNLLCFHGEDDFKKKEYLLTVFRLNPKGDIIDPLSMPSLHRVLHREEQMLWRWVKIGFAARRSTCMGSLHRLEGWQGLTWEFLLLWVSCAEHNMLKRKERIIIVFTLLFIFIGNNMGRFWEDLEDLDYVEGQEHSRLFRWETILTNPVRN